MTDIEFQAVIDEVFASIPSYAHDVINTYCQQFIQSEFLVSDERADEAAKSKAIDIPASFLLATDTHWHFVFRPHVLNAPCDVLKTIIRHEIVHGFLISVAHVPSGAAKKALNGYKMQIEAICKRAGITVPLSYEEDLVCIINDDWGGDEMKAKEWVRQHRKT